MPSLFRYFSFVIPFIGLAVFAGYAWQSTNERPVAAVVTPMQQHNQGVIETEDGKLSDNLGVPPAKIAELASETKTVVIERHRPEVSSVLTGAHFVRRKRPKQAPVAPTESTVLPSGDNSLTKPDSVAERLLPSQMSSIPISHVGTEVKYAVGGGMYRLPRWIGSKSRETRLIPYIDINWQDQVDLSTVDGLLVDLIHGEHWHGGGVGTMLWGRNNRQLGGLAGKVPTLKDTLQLGPYLEYAIQPMIKVGVRWRHDIEKTGAAYTDLYGNVDFPKIGPIEHSFRLTQERMNRSAMHRLFGVDQQAATSLGVASYNPKAGVSRMLANYQIFLPTSETSGFAVAAGWSRLQGAAATSPLIAAFGAGRQKEVMAAFVIQIN